MDSSSVPPPPTIVINTPGALGGVATSTSTSASSNTVPAARLDPSDFSSVSAGDATASASATSATARPQTQTRTQSQKNGNLVLVLSCYLCDEQNPGDFSPTTKFLETCLLCSRHFCPIHRSESWDQVCNINHSNYYHECLERARKELAAEGQDTDTNKRVLAESLINDGIFPSLGEREKAIFTTSPVSDAKIQEIESFRNLDAALAGTTEKPKSQLIEERDVVGADIAV